MEKLKCKHEGLGNITLLNGVKYEVTGGFAEVEDSDVAAMLDTGLFEREAPKDSTEDPGDRKDMSTESAPTSEEPSVLE